MYRSLRGPDNERNPSTGKYTVHYCHHAAGGGRERPLRPAALRRKLMLKLDFRFT